MRRILLCISILVVSLLVSIGTLAQEKLKGNDLKKYKTALSYAHGTNNKMAIRLFKELYDTYPNDINVAYNLGLCYMNMGGNPDSALYYLYKVDELDTEEWSDSRSELYIAIGRSYQLAYKYDEALKIYDTIEKNDVEKEWADMLKHEREICHNAIMFMQTPVKLEVREIEGDINTKYNDYRPVLSLDQQTMIFTSRRGSGRSRDFEDGQFEEQMYITKYKDGAWSTPRSLSNMFEESNLQESATCLTNDGTELYVVRNGNLYVSKYDTETREWQMAEELPEGINTQYEENFVCVTEDGQQMFFSSNRPGGKGGFDIYRCYRLPNGNWAKPLNMGDAINTEYDEDSPIMHPTKSILYFSSTGHNTMGGYDIFYAPENPTDSSFTAVVNIGYPINTPEDDMYFIPIAQKDMAYYASVKWDKDSKESSNGFDIFEVEYDEPEVDKMAIISSVVMSDDVTGVRIIVEQNGEQIGRFVPNRKTGRFVAIVEAGGEYVVTASDGNYNMTRTVTTNTGNSYNKSGELVEIGAFDFRAPESVAEEGLMVAALPREENQTAKTEETAKSLQQVVNDDDKVYYTVQFMSLRKPCSMDNICKLDSTQVIEFVYKDGWHVYSYGRFESVKEANKVKRDIIKSTYYDDSFVRNINNYKKFLK